MLLNWIRYILPRNDVRFAQLSVARRQRKWRIRQQDMTPWAEFDQNDLTLTFACFRQDHNGEREPEMVLTYWRFHQLLMVTNNKQACTRAQTYTHIHTSTHTHTHTPRMGINCATIKEQIHKASSHIVLIQFVGFWWQCGSRNMAYDRPWFGKTNKCGNQYQNYDNNTVSFQ